jgi:branched-chain amino acid transport system permease protein
MLQMANPTAAKVRSEFGLRHLALIAGGVALLAAPWIMPLLLSKFWFKTLTEIMIWSLFTASVNLLFGYVGLISFGQALFFGVGAYGFAATVVHLQWGFWPALAIGIVAPTLLSVAVGAFAVRLTAHYFNILTVIFSLAFFFLAVSLKDFTGGDDGLSFASPSLGHWFGVDLTFKDANVQYFVVLAVVGLCFWLKHLIVGSRLGLSFLAVRENDRRAELLGYNVYLVRLAAYILAGFFAGVAGALYCAFSRYATTQYLYYTTSGEGVIYMIVGGAGSLFGPVLGTASLIVMRELLSNAWENYLIIVGIIVILCTRYAPRGLMGLADSAVLRLRNRISGERT